MMTLLSLKLMVLSKCLFLKYPLSCNKYFHTFNDNEGENFFFDRLVLEKLFDGKLWFDKDFPKL